jgi:hypothetical protein
MKWCVTFPEETVLVVRPSLAAICAGNKPAGKLLGALLYRYSIRKEHQTDAENINEVKLAQGKQADQDTSFRIYRTQAQLVEDMCGEMTEKTLHDVAVPALQILGYLNIEELPGRNAYDLHIESITRALALYTPNGQEQKKLATFLTGQLQLEIFLIKLEDFPISSDGDKNVSITLETFLIDKKYFLLLLEKVLIANRNISNCKRGRKPRTEEASDGNFSEPQIGIKIGKRYKKRTGVKKPARKGKALSPSLPAQDDAVGSHENQQPEPPKDELTPEQKTRAYTLRERIIERCGKLATKGPVINEINAIKALVRTYSDADIDDVEHYLLHCHFKWSKPDFKFKIRGNVIQDEMEPTLKLFAENPKLRDATKPETSSRPAQQEGIKYRKLPPIPTMPIRQPAGVN